MPERDTPPAAVGETSRGLFSRFAKAPIDERGAVAKGEEVNRAAVSTKWMLMVIVCHCG